MPRNGSGNYSLPQAAFVPGTTISSTSVNADFSDIASALTGSVAADGQTPITGSLRFGDGTPTNPSIGFSTNPNDGLFHPGVGQVGIALAGVQGITFSAPSASTGGGVQGPLSVVLSPLGVVQDFAGSTVPTGWLLCGGQAVSRTTYAGLFAVISTTYGIGDGTTTFNLPDCRGRVGAGKTDMAGVDAGNITTAGCGISGTTLGAAGSTQTIQLTSGQLPSITPIFTGSTGSFALNDNVLAPNGTQGSSAAPSGGSLGTTISTSVTVTPAGSISSFGNNQAHNNVQPTIIFNKIIFAGVP